MFTILFLFMHSYVRICFEVHRYAAEHLRAYFALSQYCVQLSPLLDASVSRVLLNTRVCSTLRSSGEWMQA